MTHSLLCLPPSLRRGHFYAPTVLEVTPHMSIWKEEIFGPVVVAVPFETEEEAVRLANDSPFGLAGTRTDGSPPCSILYPSFLLW
jgi:aldehyde dehydrogenase (NAD+)